MQLDPYEGSGQTKVKLLTSVKGYFLNFARRLTLTVIKANSAQIFLRSFHSLKFKLFSDTLFCYLYRFKEVIWRAHHHPLKCVELLLYRFCKRSAF
jgi:hypothetical protein